MNNGWCMDSICDDDGIYGVLDDVPWSDFKNYGYKAILGAQPDAVFTGKFRAQRQFKWGYRILVTSNDLPEFTTEERNWLRLNVDFLSVNYNLFQLNDVVKEWEYIQI